MPQSQQSPQPFLSQGWFETVMVAAAGLKKMKGMSTVVNFEIKGKLPRAAGSVPASQASKHFFHAELKDGQLSVLADGKSPVADCQITCTTKEALAVLAGEADFEAGYMHGWLKIEGNYGQLLFGLRPLYAQPAWKDFIQQAVALTQH